MIKIIIIVLIIVFIVIPLYRGESVGNVINTIKDTVSGIITATPQWLKDLVVKIFSVLFELIKVIFNAIVDFIYNKSGKNTDQDLVKDKLFEIKNQ
ncbi:MAG: hypothetical protein AAB397_01395 [Patescibacteria group bacterium]